MPFHKQGNDKSLVQGCLQGDRYWQKMLFEKYKDAMYTVAFRILRNEALAADALQEGFIEVFRGISNYRFESSLGTWIRTIIIRCSLRIQRKEFRYTPDTATELEQSGDLSESAGWDENLTGELLDKAISLLSPGYRSVFILIEVEGYSHKETATMLNISEGTSKSQLSRAKVILQHYLQEFKDDR
ncbi:MAG TPA: RNA polymerase sigma factor [Bacteroidales bacterium]|nr:RNA polymerase sigma factor [Bacteroidales bacterium]